VLARQGFHAQKEPKVLLEPRLPPFIKWGSQGAFAQSSRSGLNRRTHWHRLRPVERVLRQWRLRLHQSVLGPGKLSSMSCPSQRVGGQQLQAADAAYRHCSIHCQKQRPACRRFGGTVRAGVPAAQLGVLVLHQPLHEAGRCAQAGKVEDSQPVIGGDRQVR
jgi:hypothetical protein